MYGGEINGHGDRDQDHWDAVTDIVRTFARLRAGTST